MKTREKLARILCASLGHDPDAPLWGPTADPLEPEWNPETKNWEACLPHIDKLLEAMNEDG